MTNHHLEWAPVSQKADEESSVLYKERELEEEEEEESEIEKCLLT